MRHRLSTVLVFFLILALAVVGLAGCAKPAEEREIEDEATATAEDGSPPAGGQEGPAAGETVVSAVTSVPGTESQATPVPVGGTPGAEQPAATPVPPAATTVPSAPQQPPPSGSSGSAIWHTVQPGETLSSIARRYGTTWQVIAQANGLVNPSQIQPGDQLKIPTSGGSSGGSSGGTAGCRYHHTVQRGEWVWQIARNYGVSPYDIMAANGMTIQTASTIYSGMVLCIP